VNAFMMMSILVLCSSFKNMSKRSMLSMFLQPHILSFSALYYPHALGFSIYVSTGGELKNFAYAFDFQSAY
jgi:hypothetical protein